MMSLDDQIGFSIVVAFALIIPLAPIGHLVGKYYALKEIKNELVDKGWGYYSVDPVKGRIEFKIKESQ